MPIPSLRETLWLMAVGVHYDEMLALPRAVRFPVELLPPPGFDAERIETWPRVPGRLELVEGRLLYTPPCSDVQPDTVTDVVITLGAWVRAHPAFVLGSNEAGMRLRGSTRAADAAIWRRADLGAYVGGLRRQPPLLAVEVAGQTTRTPAPRYHRAFSRSSSSGSRRAARSSCSRRRASADAVKASGYRPTPRSPSSSPTSTTCFARSAAPESVATRRHARSIAT